MPLQLSIAQAQFLCRQRDLIGGYSKCKSLRAGILSARERVFYCRIPDRWHLEDAISLTRSLREIRYLLSTNQIARYSLMYKIHTYMGQFPRKLPHRYTVEPRNADTSGTNLKCPDYRGVLYSGIGTFYHYNEYMGQFPRKLPHC